MLSQQLFAQSESGVVLDNFSNFFGSWKGVSKYLDFANDKYVTDSMELNIYPVKNSDSLIFLGFKPNETTTTSVELVVNSKEGKLMNDKNVKYKYYANNDSLEIIKQYNKNLEVYGFVLVKQTIIIGKRTYLNRQEIQLPKNSNWLTIFEKKLERK